MMPGPDEAPALRRVRALGTTAVVAVTEVPGADDALRLLRAELEALDRACSRFRADSEIRALSHRPGTPVVVSDLLWEAVTVALRTAAATGGAVDPTVGAALDALGYDRDFAAVGQGGDDDRTPGVPAPAPGWWTVEVDDAARTVNVPHGVRLDLGASAKALVSDRAAARIAGTVGGGVLVSVGGDVSSAGPPPDGGWAVGIALDSSAPPDAVDQVVALHAGGLASSAPGVRTWVRGGRRCHHIVDPRTGCSVDPFWRLVSVSAPSCVAANAETTAAVVRGAAAVRPLVASGRPARLVRHDGEVLALNGWPADGPRRTATAGGCP